MASTLSTHPAIAHETIVLVDKTEWVVKTNTDKRVFLELALKRTWELDIYEGPNSKGKNNDKSNNIL